MEHCIVNTSIRCLDDGPVEEQMTSGSAGTPTGFDVVDTDP